MWKIRESNGMKETHAYVCVVFVWSLCANVSVVVSILAQKHFTLWLEPEAASFRIEGIDLLSDAGNIYLASKIYGFKHFALWIKYTFYKLIVPTKVHYKVHREEPGKYKMKDKNAYTTVVPIYCGIHCLYTMVRYYQSYKMKSGKVIGPEVWMFMIGDFITIFFSIILESERLPENWTERVLGQDDVQSCSNYKWIKLIIDIFVEWHQGDEQWASEKKKSVDGNKVRRRAFEEMRKHMLGYKEYNCGTARGSNEWPWNVRVV